MFRHPGAAALLEGKLGKDALVPIVVKAELLSLAAQRGWQLPPDLLQPFQLVDISSPEVIDAYVRLDQRSRSLGHRMGKNDLWIAAVTKSVNGTLLTTDADFVHLHPADIPVERLVQQALFGSGTLR